MKFFRWLKEEIVGNVGVLFLSLAVSFFCVIMLNVLMTLGIGG